MKNLKLGLLTLTLMFALSLSAQKKISQLPELVVPDSTDVLPIVNDGVTKKITVANLLSGVSSSGSSLWEIENDSYVPKIDNQRYVFEYYDTKIVLDSLIIDGELVIYSGNIITHIEGSDTIIMYDGVVYKTDFGSFTLQEVIYNSSIIYSERLNAEGQKTIYSPGKTFAIDAGLEVFVGGVNFSEAEYFKPPQWTTSGRAAYPEVSYSGYNTDLNQMEYWNGTSWVQF